MGATVQLTAVLLVPVTDAVSVFDCPEVSVAVAGDTATAIGISESTALAVFPVAAWLAAVTVTVWAESITAGA